jgi:hypothetical protein
MSRLAWVVSLAVCVLSACPRTLESKDAGPDPLTPQVCTADSECEGYEPTATVQRVRCEGTCVYLCSGVQDECNSFPNGAARYCDANNECSFGCRPGSVCPTAGDLCVAGTCQAGASQCATKCDCDPGEVCLAGACQQPASTTCSSGDQCPRGPTSPVDSCNSIQCNGITDSCFDANPQACTASADCVGRFGCTGNVTCSCNNSACVPSTACTAQNESTTCGSGNYCDSVNVCQALPSCTTASDCTSLGLTCNVGTGRCERANPCTSSADCTIAPNTHCPTGGGFCTIPTCLNGGPTCAAGLECNAQGRCVTPGLGACVGDGQCASTAYCDLAASECRTGCRNNASCPSGQECDGNRNCVTPGGGGGGGNFGEPCVDGSECNAPMICGIFTSTCAEQCAAATDCVACNASFGACTCNAVGFCAP